MNKIAVNVTDRKNKKHALEGQKGQTLMQLIDQHELANPYGICGGEPMCGTCHVLQSAGSDGNIGPNLDHLKLQLDQIIYAVTNGIGVMQAWEGILTQEEIEAVSYYVFNSTNK